MQIPQNDLVQLQQTIASAKEILILTSASPSVDRMAASLAFYLSLPQIGKQVSIVSPEPVKVGVANLVGIDKVKDSLGSKNFVISLDYVEGSIEKVSYNIENDKFNLVIEPRSGFAFSKDKVHYGYSGTNADLLIAVGARDKEDLGSLSAQLGSPSDGKTIINIDVQAANTRFGKINLVYPGMVSLSEVVAAVLKQLGLPLDADTASNLLTGIASATDNFSSPKTSADSFEAAAYLLRTGGQNLGANTQPYIQEQRSSTTPFVRTTQTVIPQPSAPPVIQPMPVPAVSNQGPVEDQAPPDWLKPKIFKSRNSPSNPSADYIPSEGRGGLS